MTPLKDGDGRLAPAPSRSSRPLQLATLVTLLYACLALGVLRHRGWDVTTFIVAGDKFAQRSELTAPIAILPNSAGYDGQFYYRLALDPFTSKITDFGITLDNPATRGARIGYPFLGWIFSASQPPLLPWTLLGLNLAGLFCLTWMATSLAQRHALPTWLALAPALYPGFILTMLRDTTEIVAVAFAFAALSLALRRQFWRAAPFACCAVLTRETTLFYLAGFGLVELADSLRRRRWSWNLAALALPAIIFFAWQYAILRYWGASSYSGTGQNIGPPFAGLASFFTSEWATLRSLPWMSKRFELHAYYIIAGAMCVGLCGLAATQLRKSTVPAGLRASWLLYLALIICLTTAIWIEPYDFLRAFSDCFVIGSTVILLSRRTLAGAALLTLITPIWLLTAAFVWLT